MRSPCIVKLVEFLQGKWLGHPLHPVIVHVPVGAWLAAFVIDVILVLGSSSAVLERVALWCVGVGLAGALLAVPPGVADWSLIKRDKPAWQLGIWHMMLNLLAALAWAVNFGLRLSADGLAGEVTPPVLWSSVVGLALLLAGTYLGALMVFDHGIGVARQSKKKWRAIAARGGANLPEEK